MGTRKMFKKTQISTLTARQPLMAWIYFFFHLLAFIKEIHTLFTKFQNSKYSLRYFNSCEAPFCLLYTDVRTDRKSGQLCFPNGKLFPIQEMFPKREIFPIWEMENVSHMGNHFPCGKLFPGWAMWLRLSIPHVLFSSSQKYEEFFQRGICGMLLKQKKRPSLLFHLSICFYAGEFVCHCFSGVQNKTPAKVILTRKRVNLNNN